MQPVTLVLPGSSNPPRWLSTVTRLHTISLRQISLGLRAYASLLFGRRLASALLVFGAACFEPSAGAAGVVAVIAAALTVRALHYRRDLADAGYFSVSSLLCGLAAGHLQPISWLLLAKAFLLGSAAALLTAGLAEFLARLARIPVLVLPFVLTAGTLAPLLSLQSGASFCPRMSVPDLPVQLPAAVSAILRAFGAIVFQPTTAAGLLILLALLVESRIGAALAVWGIALASLLGLLVSPHVHASWIQAARYNSLLVSLAIGAVYFVPSYASLGWATFGALVTAWLTFSIGPIFAQWQWPLLAWPFVLVALPMLRAIDLRQAGCPPKNASLSGESPESNLRYSHMLVTRFGRLDTVRVNLPVSETWSVTQGFDGAHTHSGLWRHALDFEILDADGFPFRGGGSAVTDYYCFDAAVHAVLAGTVIFVYSNHPDNAPGFPDLTYPYGNVVIIQHAPAVYSVLAHLRQGSILVQVGQVVAAGTPVGRCGSSGRSPRPHLHLQLQTAAELGSPTIPFELVHYCVARHGAAEYVPYGVPTEGDRVAGSIATMTTELPLLKPGNEFVLEDQGQNGHRLRAEISPAGERYLSAQNGRERFYFSCVDGVATFTTHVGTRRSPLWALALALPRVPPFAGEVTMTDHIPPEWLTPSSFGWLHDFASFFGIRAVATARSRVVRSDEGVRSHTRLELRWCGRVWLRYTAEVNLRDEVIDSMRLASADRLLIQASRASAGSPAISTPRRRLRLEPALACLTLPVIAGVAAASLMLSPTPSEARSAAPDPAAESVRFEAAGNLNQALEAAGKVVTQNPREYFPVLRLAYLEKLAKRYSASALHYAQAASLAPGAVEPLLGEIQALLAAGAHAKVLSVAEAILQLDPKSYVAHSSRAWARYQMGRYKEALAEYSWILELYPGDIEMRLGRAYSLAGLKRSVEASIEFREVLKRVPNERRARSALGLP